MKEYKIYKLIDPYTEEIRYIGVTTRKLSERLSQHCCDGKYKTGNHKVHWIKSILNKNERPIIELIEVCNEENWEDREIYWIGYYDNLTNTKKGGKGIVHKTKEVWKRIADKKSKCIIQLDKNLNFIKEYKSIKVAGEELNILSTNIGNVLNGRAKTAGNFHFVYKDDYNEDYTIDLSNSQNKKLEFNTIKVKLKDNTSYKFKTIEETATFLNVSGGFISMILRKQRNLKNSKKLQFVKYIKI